MFRFIITAIVMVPLHGNELATCIQYSFAVLKYMRDGLKRNSYCGLMDLKVWSIGSGPVRGCSLAAVGVALLNAVYHCGGRF